MLLSLFLPKEATHNYLVTLNLDNNLRILRFTWIIFYVFDDRKSLFAIWNETALPSTIHYIL
jgi:hypothetical protein